MCLRDNNIWYSVTSWLSETSEESQATQMNYIIKYKVKCFTNSQCTAAVDTDQNQQKNCISNVAPESLWRDIDRYVD